MGRTGIKRCSLGILVTSCSQSSEQVAASPRRTSIVVSYVVLSKIPLSNEENTPRIYFSVEDTNSRRMRRTRHVVLPVRSWQHTGLLIVSLACLTLGLVSRDREGQAGSLAGPDLQHCAPHKVDACPNENVFNRLLFYDDPASDSGLTLSVATLAEKSDDVRKIDTVKSIGRVSTVTSPRSVVHRSAERRSLERVSVDRNSAVRGERREIIRQRDSESRRSSINRATDRDSRTRFSRVANEKREHGRLTDRESRNFNSFVDRAPMERRESRRHLDSREKNTASRDRTAHRSLDRDSTSRNARSVAARGSILRDSVRSERGITTRNSRINGDDRSNRRIRTIRSVEVRSSEITDSRSATERRYTDNRESRTDPRTRINRSLERESSIGHSSLRSSRSSERQVDRYGRRSAEIGTLARVSGLGRSRLTDETRAERRYREIRTARSVERIYRSASERRDVRSTERDSRIRESRTRVEHREEARSQGFRASSKNSRSAGDRLPIEGRDSRLNRQVRDSRSRSIERSSSARDLRSMTNYRDDGLDRLARSSPITDFQVRNSRSRTDRASREARYLQRGSTIQRSRSSITEREDNGRQRASRSPSSERESTSRNSRSINERGDERLVQQRRSTFHERESKSRDSRLTDERRASRLDRQIRDARSLERNAPARHSRSLPIRSTGRGDTRVAENRDKREYRTTEDARASRLGTEFNRRDRDRESVTRYSRLSADRSTRRSGPAFSLRRADTMNQRKLDARRELVRKDETSTRRIRTVDLKTDQPTRSFERIVETRASVFKSNELDERPDTGVVTWTKMRDPLVERIVPSLRYEGLKELGILVLCALYGVSLYNGKGGLASIVDQARRYVAW